jgi:hypothetical protein
MLLLLIVDELTNLCLNCCWVMLLMLIHALGIAKYDVVMKVVVFDEFCENGSKWRNVILMFLNEMVML